MPVKKRINLGAFTSTTRGTVFDLSGKDSLAAQSVRGSTLLAVSASFVGTFTLEVSPDNSNWIVAKDMQGDAISMTGSDVEAIGTDGLYVAGKCSAYTSGTLTCYLVF